MVYRVYSEDEFLAGGDAKIVANPPQIRADRSQPLPANSVTHGECGRVNATIASHSRELGLSFRHLSWRVVGTAVVSGAVGTLGGVAITMSLQSGHVRALRAAHPLAELRRSRQRTGHEQVRVSTPTGRAVESTNNRGTPRPLARMRAPGHARARVTIRRRQRRVPEPAPRPGGEAFHVAGRPVARPSEFGFER